MPRVFFRCSGAYSGRALGAGAAAFFALHLTEGGKVDICGRIDVFFCSSLHFEQKTHVMTFK